MEWISLSTAASRPSEIAPNRQRWLLCQTTAKNFIALNITYLSKEKLWESLKEKLQSSRVDRAAWRWRAQSASLKKAPTFSSRAGGKSNSMRPSRLIGRNVTGVRGDAANLDDLDRLFDTVKREKGKIDILFASAGKGEPRHWARLPSSTSMRPST